MAICLTLGESACECYGSVKTIYEKLVGPLKK
jgi:hypothetical protein